MLIEDLVYIRIKRICIVILLFSSFLYHFWTLQLWLCR